MKKIVVILAALLAVIGCFGATACDGGSSTAVTAEELVREDFAANKEKEDDEKGREHIEIPADAEKITIKNEETNEDEEWTVVRSVEDFSKIFTNEDTLSRNYIMANDIELKEWFLRVYPTTVFTGKFNGNNYKFVNEKEARRTCLFYIIRNAVIENVIFSYNCGVIDSQKIGKDKPVEFYALIAYRSQNSVIKNCVNYSQSQVNRCGSFVNNCSKTIIENCINYGDFSESLGGIACNIENCTIRNCKNYGNLATIDECLGGIVSIVYGDNIIENCENYGHIATGCCGAGGIVGKTPRDFKIPDEFLDNKKELPSEYFTENQIIKNCKNCGDIYLLREKENKRFESASHTTYCDDKKYKTNIYEFGGIAGSISKAENCVNEGSFYGFENIGGKIKVNFLGGIAGAAKQVTNCENKGIIKVQKGRAINVDEICGYIG